MKDSFETDPFTATVMVVITAAVWAFILYAPICN